MLHVNRKRVSVTEPKFIPNEHKRKSAAQAPQHEIILAKNNNNTKKNVAEFDYHLKWTACYSDDIYEYWKSVELDRTLLDLTNDFFTWRSHQVVALKHLVRKYGFTNSTLHLAIHILDTFLSKHEIAKEERKLTVIACFVVAAKVEEDESKIPSLAQVNKTMFKIKTAHPYTLDEYKMYEVKILRCTRFELNVPTVATFANFYSRTTVSLEDFQTFNEQGDTIGLFNSHEHMLKAVNNLLFHLVDITCEILFLRNTLPSQTAAACVYAARHLNNIHPNWSIELETLTQYNESDMILTGNPIIKIYTKQLIT